MAAPILATKFYIPPYHPKVVVRTRLIERINTGLSDGNKLTLISAPAGFGKTTLTTEWITYCDRQVAWLTLDEGDSDPIRFLTYFVAALRTALPAVGEEMLHALNAAQSSPPPIEAILSTLLNEISSSPGKIALVLDDYHIIDSRTVDNALTFFIEHMPPQVHMVITTREDPALPISRLRARNQLTELRAADLRFNPAEAAEFLSQMMDLDLSADDVTALESRTEGWIAGLQLAALSIKGQGDVTEFIRVFAGDHRYIVDYLVEEVLQRQPEETRIFLLQTSILNRLNGSLCDAVTSQSGGKARLESLQRSNLFLIPLDDKQHWYRYHHLFADVLRMHLITDQPDQVPILHGRASDWYERNGSADDAIHHALAAQDFQRAAELIERALPVIRQNRQEAMLLRWLQSLPEEVLQNRPVLSVHYVGTLLQNGQLDGVEARLRDAERWLDLPADAREHPVFVDEKEFQRLPGSVAMYHAAIALAQGDAVNTVKHARKALAIAREDDDFMRGAASSLLGLASWTNGDLETGHQMFSKGMAHLQKVGYISDVIGGSVTLADIRITQGRLREAMGIYESGLQLATQQGTPPLRGAADMHVGLSEISREHNDLDAAEQHLVKSKELGELNGLPKNPYRWRVAMARIHEAQGDLDETLDLLNEAERLYQGDFSPNVRPVSALKARVWIAQGKLDKAIGWAGQTGLSVDGGLSYLREFEHITLARILFAQYKNSHTEAPLHEAIGLLARILKAAEEGGRMGNVIEILVLQALANEMRGDIPAGLVTLERALILAEPEGYVRMFLDEGEPMRLLIEDLRLRIERQSRDHHLISYADNLLDAFTRSSAVPQLAILPNENQKSKIENLVEPLSQRELEILRLFKTELSGPEIAQELVIALSTVRTHTKRIYSKLNVNSRRSAVKRAMELGLI